MGSDTRAGAAEYYDRMSRPPPGDLAFYRARLPTNARVLELGCGTGRITLPLAADAAYVHGLDRSTSMLAVCRRKIVEAGLEDDVCVEPRVWTPDQLLHLVESHDFEVLERHGGYEGEAWGEGTELVVGFRMR